MVATETGSRIRGARGGVPRTVASIVVGVVVGLLAYYLVAVAATAPIPGNFTITPLALIMIAVVGAAAVVAGWRWPTVGIAAGVFILVVVAWAVAGRLAWSSSGSDWLSPFNAVAFGAATGYPTLLASAMITVSALRMRSRRAR